MRKPSYWQRLRSHPGVPLALVMTLAGAVAGADRGARGALMGAAVMAACFWAPVLWTARTQPVDDKEAP